MADLATLFQIPCWLVVLALAALGASVPGMPGRRHAAWLLGFCATRLLIEIQPLVFPFVSEAWGQLGSVAAAALFWEFARQVCNESRHRRISGATHLVALEAVTLIWATDGLASGARPSWVVPIDLLFALLPALLGIGGTLLLWATFTRASSRLMLLGLGLASVASSNPLVAGVGLVAPWLAAVGLGLVCFADPATRTRHALACVGGFTVTILLGPLLLAVYLRQLEADASRQILDRAQQAASPVQGRIAARLGRSPPDAEARRALAQHLDHLRVTDPLLHSFQVWQVRGGRRWLFDPANGEARAAPEGELAPPATNRPFLSSRGGTVAAHVPLASDRFESPVTWLTLEYPAIFWEVQRQNTRRTGAALIGVIAVFCTVGFVLAARQAIEKAQHLMVERVQAADRAKNEFLAFLSHEMRTPLQTILGRADLLRRESAAAGRHTDAIETQGTHLLRLVNDLLDLGTIEAGKLKLRPSPFNLRQLLVSLEETHGPVAALKGLALEVVVAPEVPADFRGDEARLRQVLGNLIGNAVKYTRRGGATLDVKLDAAASSAESCRLVFTVSDTGPGLPPDKIPQLFTLFTRLDSGGTFMREGTGVGLALVRRLCDLMGGTVTATNRAVGGAEFTVALILPSAAATVETSPSDDITPAAQLRVLVAEDNDAAREFLVEAIASLGHGVESVSDGLAVLERYEARPFDVVVLDVNLPGRDGIALAGVLATRQPRPRLVGCSAEVLAGTRTAAAAAGMDVYLEKPVTMAALAAALAPAAQPARDHNLFERLRSPQLAARARDALAHDLPVVVRQLRQALGAHDRIAVQHHAHLLRSTALFANQTEIAELCRRLEHAAAAGDDRLSEIILEELTLQAAEKGVGPLHVSSGFFVEAPE